MLIPVKILYPSMDPNLFSRAVLFPAIETSFSQDVIHLKNFVGRGVVFAEQWSRLVGESGGAVLILVRLMFSSNNYATQPEPRPPDAK